MLTPKLDDVNQQPFMYQSPMYPGQQQPNPWNGPFINQPPGTFLAPPQMTTNQWGNNWSNPAVVAPGMVYPNNQMAANGMVVYGAPRKLTKQQCMIIGGVLTLFAVFAIVIIVVFVVQSNKAYADFEKNVQAQQNLLNGFNG